MAIEFTTEHRIEAPPEVVFEKMTDLDAAGEWMPNFIGIEVIGDVATGVGARWRETRKMFGREATEEFEVTEYEPPTRLGLRVDGSKGSSGKGEYRFTYTLEPDDGATILRMHAEIRMPGCLGAVMGKLFAGSFRKMCAKDTEALKAWIEASGD